jgi:hypothetical protein
MRSAKTSHAAAPSAPAATLGRGADPQSPTETILSQAVVLQNDVTFSLTIAVSGVDANNMPGQNAVMFSSTAFQSVTSSAAPVAVMQNGAIVGLTLQGTPSGPLLAKPRPAPQSKPKLKPKPDGKKSLPVEGDGLTVTITGFVPVTGFDVPAVVSD